MRAALLFLALLLPAAAAQPFSTLELGVGGTVDAAETGYHAFWQPSAGAELRVEAPFYAGTVGVGVHVSEHRAQREDVPDWLAVAPFLQLGHGLRLPGGLGLHAAGRVGILSMDFDDDAVTAAVRRESELMAGGYVRLDVALGRGWRAGLGVSAMRVFTHRRIDLVAAQAGVSRTVRTPGWLREVLR